MTNKILSVLGEKKQSIPLILDSPHSGIIYPDDFDHITTLEKLRQAEDSYVHELYMDSIKQGAVLIHANFPRSYIDPNRSERDFSYEFIEDGEKYFNEFKFEPTIKTKLGIGLIWTKVPPDGEKMYNRKLLPDEVRSRINKFHRPYHKKLSSIMDSTFLKYGCFYHINCHSMQNNASAMSTQSKGTLRPDFVIGDKDGKSCGKSFTNFVVDFLRELNYSVEINDPYKGMELVSAYSNPKIKKNSLQIEVNRKIYMNEFTRVKTDQFQKLKSDLNQLICMIKSQLEKGFL